MSAKAKRPDRRFERVQFIIRFIFDSVAFIGAWFLSYYIRFFVLPDGIMAPDTFSFFAKLAAIAFVSGFIFLYIFDLYETSSSIRRKEISAICKATGASFLFMVTFYYFVLNTRPSRVHLGLYCIFLFVMLMMGRGFANQIFASMSKDSRYAQKVLLVGSGDRLVNFYNSVTGKNGVKRFKISGHYMGEGDRVRRVHQIEADSLIRAVEEADADIVVISFPDEKVDLENRMIVQALELYNQKVYVLPKIPKTYTGSELSEIKKIPVIQLNYSEPSSGSKVVKRLLDVVSCTCGVIVLSPVYIIIALLVKLSSPGPVFFKQKRVTADGREFYMYKFRSMRTDMPEGNVHWTTENDPRVTKIGKILRKTSLDELPQFFNVIGGSMSLIGPRPERPELEANFKKTIPGYYMRHRMKAGITGWAQVNGLRGNTSLEKRIEYDLYYVRNWSFFFDIKIFFLTFFRGFVNKNAY